MPMSFPDLNALRNAFDHQRMLPYRKGETEDAYRERCAVWSEEKCNDHIQAQEIRSGKGWDQWGESENIGLLMRLFSRNPDCK